MIVVDGVVRRLGSGKKQKTVLDGVTFTAATDEITAFLGPNGAGKTTTMRVLATMLRPHAGTVTIDGCDVVEQADEVRRLIGLVTEEAGLPDRLTIRELLTLWGRAHGIPRADLDGRIDETVELLGLGEFIDHRCGRISKGTRQKAAVARAILHRPQVLLLDEPTANLDVVATMGLLDLLTRPDIRSGRTVLLATHRLEEADRYASHVVGISRGATVISGTPAEIAKRAGTASFIEGFVRLIGDIEVERAAEQAAKESAS